ncbi:MAG: hypothetical protein LHV68_12475 [Elusimicrobia bacterium]|nr:hypothetical protein [Candidatus Liberimonas magnetica]
MNKFRSIFALIFVVNLLIPNFIFAAEKKSVRDISDDKLIEMLDSCLKSLPDKIAQLDPKVRRIVFFSLKVDRSNIPLPLFRQMYGNIEAALLKVQRPILVYAPEIKPIKVVSSEDSITLVSGFQSTEEIKDIASKLRLDGYLEGELYVTHKTLYLNLRIFETDNMAIVWSQELTSVTQTVSLEKKLTGVDYGIGTAGIPVGQTSSSSNLTVPSYANYYTVDLRISQKTITGDSVRYTLAGGALYLYDGISGNDLDPTIVTNGSIAFFTRIGARISIIPVKSVQGRDYIAAEINYGRLFGMGASGVNTFGIKIESDITKNITVGAGINYIPITDVTVNKTNSIVKVGGLSYEISLLRFNYKP